MGVRIRREGAIEHWTVDPVTPQARGRQEEQKTKVRMQY